MSARLIVPGVYAIPVGPVNTFLVDAPDGCALIDAGFPGSGDKILQALRGLGKQPGDVRHILLTHAHPDHIGSLARLQQATGAAAYMHPLDAPIATSGTGFRPLTPSPGLVSGLLFRAFIRPIASVDPAIITHTVEDGDTLPIAGGLEAIHVPGHCAGQLTFLWPQQGGVLFAADTCGNMPVLSLSLGYEDLAVGRRSLTKLAQRSFQTACFGHGKAITRNASARFKAKWG